MRFREPLSEPVVICVQDKVDFSKSTLKIKFLTLLTYPLKILCMRLVKLPRHAETIQRLIFIFQLLIPDINGPDISQNMQNLFNSVYTM